MLSVSNSAKLVEVILGQLSCDAVCFKELSIKRYSKVADVFRGSKITKLNLTV